MWLVSMNQDKFDSLMYSCLVELSLGGEVITSLRDANLYDCDIGDTRPHILNKIDFQRATFSRAGFRVLLGLP